MLIENFTVGDWHVTPTKNLLVKDGAEVRLEPKVMQLLVCLAQANGELVPRNELMDEIWPRVVVADVLNNTVAILRKALGDTRSPRRYIETIPKQGYRMIPRVNWESDITERNHPDGLKAHPGEEPSFFARHRNALILGIFLLIVSIIYFQSKQSTPLDSEPGVSDEIKTIAVLPFNTFSDQNDIKFFTEGLVEELIHQLAGNPEFRVIARTSSESFKNTNSDIKHISTILGARYIMEGSVRQSAELLRVTVQLNDAENGFHLWSKTFDHQQNDNLLKTQIAIGKKVTDLISTNQPTAVVYQNRKHPSSDEAYKLFLVAQSHLKFIEVSHLEKALEYFQRSIEIAPDYALAYSGIAATYLLLHQYKHTSLSETVRLSSDALKMALSIEPGLAEAYAVRGLQETYTLQYEVAEEDFKRAIELNPGLRFARHNYGFMLWSLSRPKEALEQFEIALEMDPLSTITNFAIGDVLGNLGEFDLAISHYLQCQELLPDDYSCFLGIANIYKLTGNFDQFSRYLSLASQRVDANNYWLTLAKAFDAFQNDKIAEARVLLTNASAKNPNNGYLLRVALMVDIGSSSVEDSSRNIKRLIIENPNNIDLNLLLGLSSFFESNCELSISQYEQVIKENPKALLEVWDFSYGVSHLLNLAFCYQENGRQDEAENYLQQYQQFIQSLPEVAKQIPGVLYNDARLLMLSGEVDAAAALVQQLQDWPFIWLFHIDPVWNMFPEVQTSEEL